MGDAPDGYQFSDVEEFTANLDSGELSARLYSPAIYARVGQILYMTDFTRGFSGLAPEVTGATQSIKLQTQHAMYNGLAAYLSSESSDDSDCYLAMTIPYVKARYYIMDMGYFLFNEGTIIRNEFFIHEEGQRHHVDLYHTYYPFKLETNNEDDDRIDITSLESSDSVFGSSNHIRIIIDTETQLYKEISINGVKFAVTDMSYYKVAAALANNIQFYHSLGYSGSVNGQDYLQWIVISVSDNL